MLFKYASIGSKTNYKFYELYDRLGSDFGRLVHMSMHFFLIASNRREREKECVCYVQCELEGKT